MIQIKAKVPLLVSGRCPKSMWTAKGITHGSPPCSKSEFRDCPCQHLSGLSPCNLDPMRCVALGGSGFTIFGIHTDPVHS